MTPLEETIRQELENFEDSDGVIRNVNAIALASALGNRLEEVFHLSEGHS